MYAQAQRIMSADGKNGLPGAGREKAAYNSNKQESWRGVPMKTKLIIDEDSVYEIDEECDQVREEQERNRKERRQRSGWPGKRKREKR